MLKVKTITKTNVTYKEKTYPAIEMDVEIDADEQSHECLGSESLANAILDKDCNPVDREAAGIEHGIYAYFPDYILNYDEQSIIRWIELNMD